VLEGVGGVDFEFEQLLSNSAAARTHETRSQRELVRILSPTHVEVSPFEFEIFGPPVLCREPKSDALESNSAPLETEEFNSNLLCGIAEQN